MPINLGCTTEMRMRSFTVTKCHTNELHWKSVKRIRVCDQNTYKQNTCDENTCGQNTSEWHTCASDTHAHHRHAHDTCAHDSWLMCVKHLCAAMKGDAFSCSTHSGPSTQRVSVLFYCFQSARPQAVWARTSRQNPVVSQPRPMSARSD